MQKFWKQTIHILLTSRKFERPESEEWPRDKRRSTGLDKRLGGNLIRRRHTGGPRHDKCLDLHGNYVQ